MLQHKAWNRFSFVLVAVVTGILALTIVARHVVAGPTMPAAPQSSGWFVQDSTIFGDRIDMVSANDGWMLKLGYRSYLDDDKSAYLYRWNGNRWSLFTTLPHTQLILRADIDMVSATDGWVVLGGPLSGSENLAQSAIYRWNGNTWNSYGTITAPNAVSLNSVDMLSPTDGWASGAFNFGTMYYHWDGSNWQFFKQGFGDYAYTGLDMVSSSDGWAVGSGISRWNGQDWINVPSSVDRHLGAISMVSANDGWIVGGGYQETGVILRWNGSTWNEVASPVDDGLYAIDMVSADDGWIVGENGTILHWDGAFWTQYSDPSILPYDLSAIDMLSPNSGWITGYGGVFVYDIRPELAISFADGSPGSFFTLSGSDYPANEIVAINVNGHDLGMIATDENGSFTLILSTADADEGNYTVTVSVNPGATTQFVLDAEAPLRSQEDAGTEITVPAGIAHTELGFLPAILR